MNQRRWIPVIICFVFGLLYLYFQIPTIYGGDSGNLVASAYTGSIAHPPGYPLYTFLGWILIHVIPFQTVAWRVGLLSSIPMAISLYFLWQSISILTQSPVASTISVLVFGLSYPVWLYAIVPEVFGLYSLFSSLLLYLFLQLVTTRKPVYLLWLVFIAVLSLTHHQLIVLLLGSILLYLWKQGKFVLPYIKHHVPLLIGLAVLGFLPYVYAPIVSAHYPPFDWEHPATLIGFIRLVTRASYGTFRASAGTGQNFIDRLLNSGDFIHYVVQDFGFIGLAGFITGIIVLIRRPGALKYFFLMYFGLLVFFFFYAGYASSETDFIVGTLERFFIIPYQVLSIFFGIGVAFVLQYLDRYCTARFKKDRFIGTAVTGVVIVTVLLLPVRLVATEYTNFRLLYPDRTIENYTNDLFRSVPQGAIVDGSSDNFIFSVFYSHYVLHKRPDIKIVRLMLLYAPYYKIYLKKTYPDIVLPPDVGASSTEYIQSFITANAKKFSVALEEPFPGNSGSWLLHGLVYVYQPQNDSPIAMTTLASENSSLWENFSDPKSGVLGRYQHLLLNDILRLYAKKHIEFSQLFMDLNELDNMEKELRAAYRLMPSDPVTYVPNVLFLVNQNRCSEAYQMASDQLQQKHDITYIRTIYHELYDNCHLRTKDVIFYESAYEQMKNASSVPIQ